MKQDTKKAKLTTRIEKENQRIKIFAFVLLGLFAFVMAWFVLRPSTQHLPTVLSLQDKWDSLETSARNLQSDAFLTSVDISLDKRETPYTVTAEYHSSSVADKMIFVGIDHSGEIYATWVDISPSTSGAQKPISREDWTLDSQDALFIFSKDEAIKGCLKSSKSSIKMSLNCVMTENPSWVLSIIDCPEKGTWQDYYLNAQTGERVDPFNQ